ncbi:MAG TPA: hypothetical protein VHB77_21530 [Planctomycetaceae bacterium]|nr:hypothetical protein [Planctomycetaceae bacterium]
MSLSLKAFGPRLLTLVCLSLLAALFSGCGRSNSEFHPAIESAREALDTALESWRNGAPVGTITSTEPSIDLFDARRQLGERLSSFEVLEELPDEGPKQFLVRLKLEGAKGPEETKYIVLGKDPLLVFREEDYHQPAGM